MRVLVPAIALLAGAQLCSAVHCSAAEKEKSVALIESSRAAIENIKARSGDNKLPAGDIERAANRLNKASAALKSGEKMFGGISDEAEEEIRHHAALVGIDVNLGFSRLERSKIEAELAVLTRKVEAVQARVKIFDDFRAEIARLKAENARNEAASKEVSSLRAEKAALAAQVEKLTAERESLAKSSGENKKLTIKLEELQSENSRLAQQVEKGASEMDAVMRDLETLRAESSRKAFPAPQPLPVTTDPVPQGTNGASLPLPELLDK